MLWEILAGLVGGMGLFLFGMQMMASGMQKVAGDRMRRILEVLTNKPVWGVFTGLVLTVLVQSSSTATVMVVSFANAGLISLSQAVSVIIGANIGTTVTAQLISFEFVTRLALPAVGMGALINYFGRRRLYRYFGQALLGFGFLFLGISTMTRGMTPLQNAPLVLQALIQFGRFPVLGVLCGAAFTALIHSSGASIGVIIGLAMRDLISFEAAVPLILGTNIGTCIDAVIASLGASVSARRAAAAHVLFNVIGAGLALIFLHPFVLFLGATASTVPRQVANAHALFNIMNAVVVLLFFQYFNRFIRRIIPGVETSVELGPKYLDPRILKTPGVALGGAKKELARMAFLSRDMLNESIRIFSKNDLKTAEHTRRMEELIDGLEKEINIYLSDLSQHSLTQQQSRTVRGFQSAANDLERIGDHAENILQLAETKVEDRLHFSDTALEEINMFYSKVDAMLGRMLRAFEQEDIILAGKVIDEDDSVDAMEKELRRRHIDRINNKECYPAAGVLYLDVLSNLERIADHAVNFAQMIISI